MNKQLQDIGSVFRLPGEFYAYRVLTQGNINSTYRVTYRCENKKTKTYIFQKINTYVFNNPEKVMANIELVTSHMQKNYPDDVSLHFHHTEDGKNYHYDSDGSFWRVMNDVDGRTFDICDDLDYIEACGKAFGDFQMKLADFDGSKLYETIPDFHNTKKRLDTLFDDIDKHGGARCGIAKEEIDYIASVRDKASELSVKFANGELPIRVTHNDTKANNVIFDRKTKKPLVVIDLDTVMPGMPMYDFGDAVRFICNTSVEDEPDTTVVFFDTAKFRAFAKGFVGATKDSLTVAEIGYMVLATFSITIELAARFLDDYITGDKYFKCDYPEHNLVRTRCQLKLAQDIEKKADELEWIVKDCI